MKGKIAIVGSGLIGSSWATMFLTNGYSVMLYDISEEQLSSSKKTISENLEKLKSLQLLFVSETDCLNRITTTTDLKTALKDAIYAQESACESKDFKKKIFMEMDELAGPDCVLASSTSTIPASTFTENLKNRHRCLVAHPVNPPLFLKLVELVPAPWTSEDTIEKCSLIMKQIGQEPVRLNKEVIGFAVNRIQFAILAEAWRLVQDNIMSVEDVDKVMKAGLGPRYAFYGPFETIHMNANGVDDYCQRYMQGVRNVLNDFGPNPSFDEPEVRQQLSESLRISMPLEQLQELKTERESNLAELLKMKNHNTC